ncbi:MAG: hypothetical protein ED859_02675 [Desulfuromonadales bacterium]|nr:MAG: hypothetical protein ED859_02675 [Desulfuromonadales bacterium]
MRGVTLFARVAASALFPANKTDDNIPVPVVRSFSFSPAGFTVVEPSQVSRYLAEPGRAVDCRGELALFFPHCPALAAPFLLFRLKRLGFSRCRVRVLPEGLALTARR